MNIDDFIFAYDTLFILGNGDDSYGLFWSITENDQIKFKIVLEGYPEYILSPNDLPYLNQAATDVEKAVGRGYFLSELFIMRQINHQPSSEWIQSMLGNFEPWRPLIPLFENIKQITPYSDAYKSWGYRHYSPENAKFLFEILKAISEYQVFDSVFYHNYMGNSGGFLNFLVNCNDYFDSGADAEEITKENLPLFCQSCQDIKNLNLDETYNYLGPLLFCARLRKAGHWRYKNKYQNMPEVKRLFDEAKC